MTIKHKIKLILSDFNGKLSLVSKSIKYRKEIKELEWIRNKKKDLTLEMLGLQRTVPDSEEIRILQAKLSILDELIKF